MRNPCLECDFGDKDKNIGRCQECSKRVEYMAHIDYCFDGPKERIAYTDNLPSEIIVEKVEQREEVKHEEEIIPDDFHVSEEIEKIISDYSHVSEQFFFIKNGFLKVFEIQQIFIDIKKLETKVNAGLSELCKGMIDLKKYRSSFLGII